MPFALGKRIMGVVRRKHFLLTTVGLTLLICAFFFARGASAWLAHRVLSVPEDAVGNARRTPLRPTLASQNTLSDERDTILKRNFFDSETGPLDGSALDLALEEEGAAFDPNAPPPACSNGATLVGALYRKQQPELSFASIKVSGDSAKVFQVGQSISGEEVVGIYPHAVYLGKGSRRCQLQMFADGAEVPAARPSTSQASAPPATASSSGEKLAGGLSESEVDQGIKKVSDTEYHVSRTLLNKILENQAALTGGVKVSPRRSGGQVTGVRLFRMQRDSLLRKIGLENGDELRTINGFNMSDPKSALEAYTKLQTADRLTVSLVRRGNPTTLEFKIQ